MSDTSPIAQVIDAVSGLVWPVIAGTVLWKLFPNLKSIIESRSFSIKVAGMEVSVQDATEQLRAQIEDLQQKVLMLRQAAPAEPLAEAAAVVTTPAERGSTILWVDDKPSGNAFEIAQLQNLGMKVIQATSTAEGLEAASHHPDLDAIISDMGRNEDGSYHGQAGLELLVALRKMGVTAPYVVYTTAKYAGRHNGKIVDAGGYGAISSQLELLEWLKQDTSGKSGPRQPA